MPDPSLVVAAGVIRFKRANFVEPVAAIKPFPIGRGPADVAGIVDKSADVSVRVSSVASLAPPKADSW